MKEEEEGEEERREAKREDVPTDETTDKTPVSYTHLRDHETIPDLG